MEQEQEQEQEQVFEQEQVEQTDQTEQVELTGEEEAPTVLVVQEDACVLEALSRLEYQAALTNEVLLIGVGVFVALLACTLFNKIFKILMR